MAPATPRAAAAAASLRPWNAAPGAARMPSMLVAMAAKQGSFRASAPCLRTYCACASDTPWKADAGARGRATCSGQRWFLENNSAACELLWWCKGASSSARCTVPAVAELTDAQFLGSGPRARFLGPSWWWCGQGIPSHKHAHGVVLERLGTRLLTQFTRGATRKGERVIVRLMGIVQRSAVCARRAVRVSGRAALRVVAVDGACPCGALALVSSYTSQQVLVLWQQVGVAPTVGWLVHLCTRLLCR